MKSQYLLLLLCLVLFTACPSDPGPDTPAGGSEYLNVANVDIPGGNTTATLSIQASQNCEWVVSSSEDWIRNISPSKGRGSQNVTITVSVNPSSSKERTAIVTVQTTSGSISRNITVTQAANVESLELTPSNMTFTYQAGNQDVTVTSNTHWTVSGTASWLNVNKQEGDGNGKVTISVVENTTETERSAVLTFTGEGGAEKKLEIVQAGRSTEFTVSPTQIQAPAIANTVQFTIGGDARWTLKSSESWAVLSDLSGDGTKVISVALADNIQESARTAEILVSNISNTLSETVRITQSAATRPTINSLMVNDITRTEATVSFGYTSMFPVIEYGVCYSTNSNPTVNDAHTTETGTTVQGSYTTKLTGLRAGQAYHLRAYAKSDVGLTYSEDFTFITEQGGKPNSGDNGQPGW
ncbi:MAG: BACON domain-containing protein [Prevotella sp.]|nr:BACON domain-containing protein [Prevotella sp.]